MNLVGKIFTVLIFVMSLVFMTFAVLVFSAHKNWRLRVLNPPGEATATTPTGLVYQLEAAQQRNRELKDQYDALDIQLKIEKNATEQVRGKLENRVAELEQDLTQEQQNNAQLVEANRKAVAALSGAHGTLAALRTDVDKLRQDIKVAQTEKDAYFKKTVELSDELHAAVNERMRLQARQVTLAADLANAQRVLRHFDLDKDMDLSGFPPAGLEGVVLATPQPGLIEISIGSDDGLQEGHTLEVIRKSGGQSKYMGRVVVVRTAPDKAACKVLPEYLQGNIMRGDLVQSRTVATGRGR